MTAPIAEGFSISHAAILSGTTGAEVGDLYGCRSGSLDVDAGSFDNTGDDQVLSTWQWFNFATVTIDSGFIPFTTMALLTGATMSSSGTAPNDWWHLPLWNAGSLNQSRRPILLRMPSKNSDGTASRFIDIVLYSCQLAPIKFDGPKYKDGLVVSWSAKCLMSSVDEKGTALSEKAIGRLVSHN